MTRSRTSNKQSRRSPSAASVTVENRAAWSPAHWIVGLLLGLAALALLLPNPAGATTTELESDGYAYGFVSRVEGGALLAGIEDNEAIDAEINHPLLTGDQVITNSGRMELVLPDGTAIRLGPGTIAIFDSIEGAPDSELEDGTVITLEKGELQIRTAEAFLAAEDLAIVTANATVYLTAPGTYRLTAEGESYTQVVVREGFAEAETRTGSGIARDGEALEISGLSRPFVNVTVAGPADSLELWAGDLDQAAQEAFVEDVDPRLAYAAAPLEGAGEWVYVESRRAWRPYVRADWRPFRHGRWVYTPSGLTWVASAPWGWVTSHYGFWDFVPGYGWLWLPGNTYMPAGVYWYWGPTHVAWVPWGYYNRYSHAGFGIYGWAGGDWGYWGQWTFCPTRYFGRRGYDRYWDTGRDMARERRFAVPRGIVTTDTRGLSPDRWGKPTEAIDHLVRRAKNDGRVQNLPDVTDFVAGKRSLAAAGRTRAIGGNSSSGSSGSFSKGDRLRPLPEEMNRGRFGTRSVGTSSGGTRIESNRAGGSNRTLEPRGSIASGRSNAGARSGGTIRVGNGSEDARSKSGGSRSVLPRGTGGVDRSIPRAGGSGRSAVGGRSGNDSSESGVASGAKVRSVGGSRVGTRDRVSEPRSGTSRGGSSGLDRSVRETPETPVRRILDRIRAHRESARGSSSSSGSRGSSATDSRGRAGSVSKGSSGGSSRSSGSSSSSRGSGSSTRSSGSGGSSVQKSSPPSRSSGNRSSSGGSNRSRSRGKN